MTEQFRPQPENPKQHAPEAGAGPIGLPPPDPEQWPQGGGSQSPERQSLPNVWDVLERRARIHEERSVGRMTSEEYGRERRKLIRSENEIYEKGIPRVNLIFALHSAVTMEPSGTLPDPVKFRELSLEEYQQFRSMVEPLTEEQLAEEIRKAEEEFKRKKKAIGRYYPTDSAGTF